MSEPRATESATLPDFLTIPEAAAAFGVSERTIRRWIEAGELTHVKYGKTVRIPKTALQPQTAEEAS